MRELLHLCDKSDRLTMFEDLKVLDLRTPADMVGCCKHIDTSWKRVVVAVRNPKVSKLDGTPDQRYEGWWNQDDAKLWPLLGFVDRMQRVAEEGDLTDPLHEWKDPGFRPAQVDHGMVFLLDWRWKPVYLSGGYPGFVQSLSDLLEISAEMLSEAMTR